MTKEVSYWYAVMADDSDNDWGYGSKDLNEAKKMCRDMEKPDAYIAVILEGVDPICVGRIDQANF